MNAGQTLRDFLAGLAPVQGLCPEGLALEGRAGPGLGALCFAGQAARSADIAGNVTRVLRWRLWLARPALTDAARTGTQVQCEALRTALETAALPAGCEALTAAPVRCETAGPGGESAYCMDLELTVTERME